MWGVYICMYNYIMCILHICVYAWAPEAGIRFRSTLDDSSKGSAGE